MDARVKPGHDELGKRNPGPGSAAHHFVLRRARDTGSVVEEAPQLPASRRMLQLAQRLRLDLTNNGGLRLPPSLWKLRRTCRLQSALRLYKRHDSVCSRAYRIGGKPT